MNARQLDLVTCTCAVLAPEPVHQAMLHYVHPYLVPALSQPSVVVAVGCDTTVVAETRRVLNPQKPTAIRASHPQQRYHAWATDDQEVLLPEHAPDHVITTTGDHILLTAEQPQVAATIATRLVRQLIMRGGEAAGGRCVHAGVVDIDGDGVLIGGHPGAGKTSVLTHLLERHGAQPVANDRTVLVPADGGSWHAIGIPLAWRFTPEGIGGSPTLSAALADCEPSRGRHLVDSKAELTPWEISRAFDRSTLPATRIARIVILMRSANGLPDKPDSTFLRRHLDFGAADFFAEDWLGIRPHLTGHHEQPSGTHAWWAKLAATAPVRVLSWTDPAELPAIAAAMVYGDWP
ncbi:MAG: hypothetical protein ACRDSZ_24915 [Pseudonocardiaceae bacterium]